MLSKLVTLSLLSSTARSFYVPGVAPTDYNDQDPVEIKAVKMTSSKTQLPYAREAGSKISYYSTKIGLRI